MNNMKVTVRFASLTEKKIHIVRRGCYDSRVAALQAVIDYVTPHGFTEVRAVEDEDSYRVTAKTPGGRSGRNVAFLDYEPASEFPDDYEPCGMCGFDHSYEQEAAHDWHIKNPE